MLLPLLISIGFASWIIIYTIEFKTQYKNQPTAQLYNLTEEVVYNDEEQVPTPKQNLVSIGVSDDEITYQNKKTHDSDGETIKNPTYVDGKPIDAGTYDVRIKISGSTDELYDGVCQVKFTILKKKVKLNMNIIEIDYGKLDETTSTTTASTQLQLIHQNFLMPNIKFLDEDGVEIDTLTNNSYVELDSINNGVYYYGTAVSGLTTTNKIVGSTYVGEIKLKDVYKDNYEFIDFTSKSGKVAGDKIYIKYKTAKIVNDSNFYTIEDALTKINNSSGTVYFVGSATSATSYVETCFTKIALTNGNPYGTFSFNINSGNNMIVPFDVNNNEYSTTTSGVTPSKKYVYSALMIPNDIILNVNGNVIVGGQIGYDQPDASVTLTRGVLYNNGTINFNENSNLKSYGYTKGNGTINLKSGATAIDVMRIYDFPGGTAASALVLSQVYPMNSWSLNNISCKTYIYNGSTYSGHLYLSVTGATVDEPFIVIGTKKSSEEINCIFQSSGDENNYILKYSKNAVKTPDDEDLYSITGSNQKKGQRAVLEIFGDYNDAQFSIKLSMISITTDTSKSLPIGYMDVTIKTGSSLKLTKSDYLFLPGVKVLCENGANVEIGSNVDISLATVDQVSSGSTNGTTDCQYLNGCVDAVDAEITINGTIKVYGNVGGKVRTTSTGAILNLTGATLTSSFKSLCGTGNTKSYSVSGFSVTGLIKNSGAVSTANFENNIYISVLYNSTDCVWEKASSVTEFKIHFMDEGKEIYTMGVAVANTTKYIFTGNEYIPSKLYYEFTQWYDSNGNSVIGNEFTGNTSTTTDIYVYADWKYKQYSFYYFYYLANEDGTYEQIGIDDSSLTPNNTTNQQFTLSDLNTSDVTIVSKPSYTGKQFVGWYIGNEIIDTGYINNKLSVKVFKALFEELGYDATADIIPICCQFVDEIKYTINFVTNIPNETMSSLNDVTSETTITLTNYSNEYDNGTDAIVMFNYWSIEDKIKLELDYTSGDETFSINLPYIKSQIETYNRNNSNDTIDISSGIINIYGNVTQKCAVSYQEKNYLGNYVDGNQSVELYCLPGTTLDYTTYYNKSIASFPSATYYSEEYKETGTNNISNHTIFIDTNDIETGVAIVFKYYKIITVTLGTKGSYVSSCSIKSDKYYSNNSITTSGTTLDAADETFKTVEGATLTISFTANSYLGFWYRVVIVKNGDTTLFDNDEGTRPNQTQSGNCTITADATINFVNG